MNTAIPNLDYFQLPAQPLIRTCNLHNLRQVISREAEPIRYSLIGVKHPSFVEVTKLELSGSKLFGLHFDSGLNAEITPKHNFEFYFVGKGGLTITSRNSTHKINAGEGVVYFPGDYAIHHWSSGSQAIALLVEKKQLEPLIHDFFRLDVKLLSKNIYSASYMSGLYHSMFNLIMQISVESDQTDGNLRFPDRDVESLLHQSCALFVEQMLKKRFDTAALNEAPEHLKVAVKYILNNLAGEISLGDLSEISGVSARSLQYSFIKYFNKSPLAFINQTKLHRVREELLSSTRCRSTVTDIAGRWGFNHTSNFARKYHALFGEYPSDTLRRSI